MRAYLDLVAKLFESAVGSDWDYGGCWITEDGTVEWCDHANDWHHSHIALDAFGDDSMAGDDGEFDEYSRDMAQEIAYSNGWIRVSTKGTRNFSVEWRRTTSSSSTT